MVEFFRKLWAEQEGVILGKPKPFTVEGLPCLVEQKTINKIGYAVLHVQVLSKSRLDHYRITKTNKLIHEYWQPMSNREIDRWLTGFKSL